MRADHHVRLFLHVKNNICKLNSIVFQHNVKNNICKLNSIVFQHNVKNIGQ